MIDIAPIHRSSNLPLGRYYPIVVETDDELDELEAFLKTERDEPVVPDILDLRPKQLITDEVLACHLRMTGRG